MTDETLRHYLILGCMGGGIFALSLFPAQNNKDSGIRWAVSGIFGFYITPLLFYLREWEKTPTTVMGGAFIVSSLAWMAVMAIRNKKLSDLCKSWKFKVSIAEDKD